MADLYFHLHRAPGSEAPVGADVVCTNMAGDQEPWIDLRGSAPDKPNFGGVTWTTSPTPIADAGWRVRRVVPIAGDDIVAAGAATTGLKQVALVRRRPDIGIAEFTERYLGHADIVIGHHGVSRYAQNVDLEPIYGVESDDDRIDGVSELWFASRDDWRDRFYLHDDSAEVVRSDTSDFIDFSTTRSILADEFVHR